MHCHRVHFSSKLNRALGGVLFLALFTGPWDFSLSQRTEGNRPTSAISVVRSYVLAGLLESGRLRARPLGFKDRAGVRERESQEGGMCSNKF